MKKIRLIALLCAILMLPSCGDTSTNTENTSSDITADPGITSETEKLTDNVPKLNFNGAKFRTLVQGQTPIGMEESDGDVVNDAVFASQRKTEERFGIEIVPSECLNYEEISNYVSKIVMSDSDEYDLVLNQMFKSGKDALNGLFLNWNTLPYIDFSNPWYTKSINKASVGDKLYMIESEMAMSYHMQTWLMVYNKTKANEISDFPDLYDLVDEGKWTIDKLNELTCDIWRDLNGDSIRDDEDFYGIMGSSDCCMLASVINGCEGKIVELNDDMSIETYINSEKTMDLLTKLTHIFTTNEGALPRTDTSRAYRMKKFVNGNVIFEAMQVNDLVSADYGMRNLKDEYGVLPLPKYDEKQDEYYTMVDGGASVMLIPATASNLELIGAVVEAMSCDYYYNVTPVYTGIAVEQKGTRDEESVKMIRNILDSRIINFAYLYDGFSGWIMKLDKLIQDENQIASKIALYTNAVTAYYEDAVNYLTK